MKKIIKIGGGYAFCTSIYDPETGYEIEKRIEAIDVNLLKNEEIQLTKKLKNCKKILNDIKYIISFHPTKTENFIIKLHKG